jgi:hypothetical protein
MIEQEIILTNSECNQILDLYNNLEFKRSRVSDSNDYSEITDYRTSYEITLSNDEFISNLLLPKLEKFGVKSLPNFMKIIRYEIGQEFKYHVDNGGIFNYRIKSISIQLTDEYEGGEMVVWGYDGDILFNKDKFKKNNFLKIEYKDYY